MITTTYPWSVSQAILKNAMLPNLLTQQDLYKVALEHEGRAKLIITNPIARRKLSEVQVGELAKKYPKLRKQILNLRQAGEQKVPNDAILALFKAEDKEARQILLEEYALNPGIPVVTWLNLFAKSTKKVQTAVVETWKKLKDEERRSLLENFFNCDYLIKGATLFEFCGKYRFFTQWMLPFPDGLDSTVKSWEIKFELLKRDDDEKAIPDSGQIRKTDLARLFAKLNNFKGDLYQSKLSTTVFQSFFRSLSSSTSETSSLEESDCRQSISSPTPGAEGADIKAQRKNALAAKKQPVVGTLDSLDFAEGKLTQKGELQACAYILTLIERHGEQAILSRFNAENDIISAKDEKPIVRRFKSIQDKFNPILQYWKEHRAELLKVTSDFKLDKSNPGLSIMEKYYSSVGLQLDCNYEMDSAASSSSMSSSSSSSQSSTVLLSFVSPPPLSPEFTSPPLSQLAEVPPGYVPPPGKNPEPSSIDSLRGVSLFETEAKPAYTLLYDLEGRVKGCLSVTDDSFFPLKNLLTMVQSAEMIKRFAPVEQRVLENLISLKENDRVLISRPNNQNSPIVSIRR